MDRYRRRIAMLSVGAQLGAPSGGALRVRSRSRGRWRSCSRPLQLQPPQHPRPTERRMRRLLLGECPARNTSRASTQRRAVSVEYPWARAAHPRTSTILYLLADHFVVDLGRARTTTQPSRLAPRRGPMLLRQASEHGDLPGRSAADRPASAARPGIFRQTPRR